jgi:hypothetical protein
MLVTVTNTSGATINDPQVAEDGVGLPGGVHPEEATHRNSPLPYPFAHIGSMANAAALQLPMHPADWNHKSVPSVAQTPGNMWNMLVAAGTVTMATAAQTDSASQEEVFLGVV